MSVFYGQGHDGELFVGDGDASAEERIKSLLGESSQVMRRRIVRRPLSGSSYISPPLGVGERDASSSSAANADPLSELLAHLAASRRGQESARSVRDRDTSSSLNSLTQLALEESSVGQLGAQLDTGSPADAELRRHFLQELLLATVADPDTPLLGEPLAPTRPTGPESRASAPTVQSK
eukprot:CAMPEP_0183335020 /NCGR_PEP_ID=MMETSP0164_2-20130417/3442_1 /TAXON_ID=221442 /ORGANISM="Coccolithus pelagicus ssp braarudi, Strain PLY182g" /LENGTH=178 /DNA_ID=CAMNT_0025504281 /DNA_START=13 /DNA_END=549 /DNA_ORIENTATION=+